MKFQCKNCRYSALCLSYRHRWVFVAYATELTLCKGCGRVWDAQKAMVGEGQINLEALKFMPVPPCGEWEEGETRRHIHRCLECSPYPRTTNTQSDGDYRRFAK